MSDDMTPTAPRRNNGWVLVTIVVVTAILTCAVTALVINITQRKNENRPPSFAKVVEIRDDTVDPAVWGRNFPTQYDMYRKTAEFTVTTHNAGLVPRANDAPEADPRVETTASKLEEDPRLVTMWSGYAFAKDYRHLRGHEYMLTDQLYTRRVLEAAAPGQPGACLNCHASTVTVMNTLGNGNLNAGFAAMNAMPYADAAKYAEHPITCIDCHDPKTMNLRITRPAAIEGIKALKASEGIAGYDVNRDATNREMRTYVCAQCHVEYYFAGDAKTLTFPWNKGTDIDRVWEYYQEVGHTDINHAIVKGAKVLKAQHPEFEAWAAGVHAANGVACADCHMSYSRVGAQKVSNHRVTTPMIDVNGACGACHKADTNTIRDRVKTIQNRFVDSRDRSLDALVALIGDIRKAQDEGVVPQEQIDLAISYQEFAGFYVDYAYSENSYGFHAPDYFQRILSQSLDASRKGQLALRGVPQARLEPSDVSTGNARTARSSGMF